MEPLKSSTISIVAIRMAAARPSTGQRGPENLNCNTSKAGFDRPFFICSNGVRPADWPRADQCPILSHVSSAADKWTVRPQADLRWRCWDGEYVVFHPPSGDTHFLNPIAGEVLRYLEHRAGGVVELSHHLSDTFELPADEDLANQVRHCLAQFRELGLIEPSHDPTHDEKARSPEPADATEGSDRT
ncbi:MAG: HPr-rel-A system PqqD family peptide chaperone [Phycisphaeraceae bacterium]